MDTIRVSSNLQNQVQSWKERLQQHGLRLSVSKSEYMECEPRIENGSIRVDGTELNKVECFKYLGSKVTSKAGRARVNAAWMRWKMATGVLCDKRVPVRLKSKIYRTVVCPVALYGCECWPTTKAVANKPLGNSVARYGDADVEVDDRCNAKRQSIQ
ncbi:hypothetical protein RB195_010669 [Necator americanus]